MYYVWFSYHHMFLLSPEVLKLCLCAWFATVSLMDTCKGYLSKNNKCSRPGGLLCQDICCVLLQKSFFLYSLKVHPGLGRFKLYSMTGPAQSYTFNCWGKSPPPCTILFTALHCSVLTKNALFTVLQCTAVYWPKGHCSLHCTAVQCTDQKCTVHCNEVHCSVLTKSALISVLHCSAVYWQKVHCSLYCSAVQCTDQKCIVHCT